MEQKKKLAVFGSTSSLGTNIIKVVNENPELYEVVTLVGEDNVEKLIEQIEEYQPRRVYINRIVDASIICKRFPGKLDVYTEKSGKIGISSINDVDIAILISGGTNISKTTFNSIKLAKTVIIDSRVLAFVGKNDIIDLAKERGTNLFIVDTLNRVIEKTYVHEEELNEAEKKLLEKLKEILDNKEVDAA